MAILALHGWLQSSPLLAGWTPDAGSIVSSVVTQIILWIVATVATTVVATFVLRQSVRALRAQISELRSLTDDLRREAADHRETMAGEIRQADRRVTDLALRCAACPGVFMSKGELVHTHGVIAANYQSLQEAIAAMDTRTEERIHQVHSRVNDLVATVGELRGAMKGFSQ